MSFSYTILGDWVALADAMGAGGFALGEAGSEASPEVGPEASPEARMMLFSDGSLTLQLEAFIGKRIELFVERNSSEALPPDIASYLGEPGGSEALFREVWLKAGSNRLVFAHSAIPVSTIAEWLADELAGGIEPLGRILSDKGIPVLKEAIELARIKSEFVASGLGLPPDTEFIARRYRLVNKKDNGGWVIKAGVIEVFSPELLYRRGDSF